VVAQVEVRQTVWAVVVVPEDLGQTLLGRLLELTQLHYLN
jgi:hypothetical protein